GAASATTMAASSTAAPNGARRARAARRKASQRRSLTAGAGSAKTDARVDVSIEEIDEQVAHDEAERDQEDHALHQRVVAREHGVDDEAADPGEREDVFGDHSAADQRAELQAEHGDHGDQRVLQHVAADDHP